MTKKSNRFGAVMAMAAAVLMCACEVRAAWYGRMIVTNDVEQSQDFGTTSSDTVIWQTNYTVNITGGGYFSRSSRMASYLLDGGSLTLGERWAYGAYAHFRQRGGDFRASGTFYNGNGGIRKDFVFGGNGTATFVSPLRLNETSLAAFAFCDNVDASFKGNDWYVQAYRSGDSASHAIWVYNGGVIHHCFYGIGNSTSPKGHFFAFNGGTRGTRAASTPSCVFGEDPRVCVYERGGCLMAMSGSLAMDLGGGFPNLGGPEGNVIKSVNLTEAARTNNGKGWDYPPSVEIIADTPGSGSNAVAVVDYDYENREITNITVLCGGEGYSGSPVANFRYKAGDALLDSPLECTIGEAYAGDFTFAMTTGGSHIYAYNTTNYCRGNLTLDVDMSERLDFKGSASGYTGDTLIYGNGFLVYPDSRKPYFPNITNIVLKSGLMDSTEGSAAYSASVFPSLQRLELYKGHIAAANIQTIADVVIGGRIFLISHNLTSRAATLGIPENGTLWVDYAATKTNGVPVTPSFSYGTFIFGSGAKIAIKNWDSIPRGRRTLVLDMSGADAPISVSGTPTIVPSSEGVLVWEDNKLYARRHSEGVFLIFR